MALAPLFGALLVYALRHDLLALPNPRLSIVLARWRLADHQQAAPRSTFPAP